MTQTVNQNWIVYQEQFQDFEGLIRMNLALAEEAPYPAFTHRLDLKLYHQIPSDNFISSEEKEKLYAIEDAINDIENNFELLDVGLVRCNNSTNFHFYGSEAELAKLDEALKTLFASSFADYKFATSTKEDAEWSLYFDILVPGPHSLREVQNLSVLNALKEHGDDFDKERPISHWAFFPNQEAAESFATKIKAEGFEVEALFKDEETAEGAEALPYTVICSKVQTITVVAINDVTWFLMDAAEELGGDYDGWESPIMPKEDSQLAV